MLYPKPSKRPKQRGHADPVSPEVRRAVMERDGGCVAGIVAPADQCRGRLTLDHVKDAPRMGRRAPSDPLHLATVCEHHHLGGWATAHRAELRLYLAGYRPR